MIVTDLNWIVGYTKSADSVPEEMFPASVPGAAQLDYANANQWPSYQNDTNYRNFTWMEDVFWLYQASLDFSLNSEQTAHVIFRGIDYQYRIYIDDTVITEGEGMFSPITCDVTKYADSPHVLKVLIYPVPKADDSDTRSQARYSCKPAACYGWDWHPRLISVGMFDHVNLVIRNACHIDTMESCYSLNDSFDTCCLHTKLNISDNCNVRIQLLDGNAIVTEETRSSSDGQVDFHLTIHSPKLWNPIGYGSQHRYTLQADLLDEYGNLFDRQTKKIGFRRVRMVMNEGSWSKPATFPKSRSDAPATLEINGKRIFAKGSNWVNAHIFPGALKDSDYEQLLTLVQNANMNILRIWGGGFVNHEAFFDLCDEKGIMVWQEFPLACAEYPDNEHYLSVLEKEATSIVRRLRTHPCLVLWCGGNELFNSWSRMTDQHHALRLLDKVCYTEDRFTPFIMTSPLTGMGHGHYLNYDEQLQEEFISMLVRSDNTAYTEFGSPCAADPDYIRQFISDTDYNDCNASNPVWTAHHAFRAWYPKSWLRIPEVEYYFGGYQDIDDLCHKTQFIQAMCYLSYFEEMRKQWPHCSMALNWCFNEPWPTFANNSLVSWPNIPKPGYYAVQQALRPQLSSLRIDRHLWWAGETFHGEIWLLNDSLEELSDLNVSVSYCLNNQDFTFWGTLHCAQLSAQSNKQCGTISFSLPTDQNQKFKIRLKVSGHPEMDSEYTYLCRSRDVVSAKGMLNV